MSDGNSTSSQRLYHCEGLIKEVNVSEGEVSFTLEPVSPYLFEKKTDDGKIERQLLFVSKKSDAAKIVSAGQRFVLPSSNCKCDLNTLLIVKANRMKVCVESSLNGKSKNAQAITVI